MRVMLNQRNSLDIRHATALPAGQKAAAVATIAAILGFIFTILLPGASLYADPETSQNLPRSAAASLSPEDALELGIRRGSLERIRSALDRGADPNTVDHTGKSALMIAARSGNRKLVNRLLAGGANARSSNSNGGTPLMFAAINGDEVIIEQLLDRNAEVNLRGSNGWGALMIAAAKGHVGVVKRLVLAGADVNIRDVYLWAPIHRAAYENRVGVVRYLLNVEGLQVDARDDQGATALHHAASQGHTVLVALLLDHGAHPDTVDTAGRTPAYYADREGFQQLARRIERAKG